MHNRTRAVLMAMMVGTSAGLVASNARAAEKEDCKCSKGPTNLYDQYVPPEVQTILATAGSFAGAFSSVSAAVDVTRTVFEWTGLVATPPTLEQQFQSVITRIDTVTGGLDWKLTQLAMADERSPQLAAMSQAHENNGLLVGDTIASRSGGPAGFASKDAMLRAEDEITFLRQYNQSALETLDTDPESPWALYWWFTLSTARPEVNANNEVYDWRVGVPFLLQMISYRLQVMAAIDPDFKTDHYFSDEIRGMIDTIRTHYVRISRGVRCGTANAQWITMYPISSPYCPDLFFIPSPKPRAIVCADIYTGIAAFKTIYLTGDYAQSCPCWDESCLLAADEGHAVESATVTLKEELKAKLPLSALIDMATILDSYDP